MNGCCSTCDSITGATVEGVRSTTDICGRPHWKNLADRTCGRFWPGGADCAPATDGQDPTHRRHSRMAAPEAVIWGPRLATNRPTTMPLSAPRSPMHCRAEMPLNSAVSRHGKMGGTRQCRFLAQLK